MKESILNYEPWAVSINGFNSDRIDFYQSIFFQGNGRIGLRAILPGDGYDKYESGVFAAGKYEYLYGNIADMVGLPDPFRYEIYVDGRKLEIGSCSNISQRIDMSTGLLERTMDFEGVHFRIRRLVSFARYDIVACSIDFKSDGDSKVEISDIIYGNVQNVPVNDDQTLKNDFSFDMLKDRLMEVAGNEQVFSFSAKHDSFHMTYRKAVLSDMERTLLEDGYGFSSDADRGHLESIASFEGKDVSGLSFEGILSDSASAVASYWQSFDIETDDVRHQSALRYNIFSMMQNAPKDDLSIGARGLTHGRYKGCYFWDTEVFMFPYYLESDQDTALRLLRYRLDNLDAARSVAAENNLLGARYPWMCNLDGSEQCNTWDIGKSELHVTADIAWAFGKYIDKYGYDGLDERKVDELLVETARYWISRFTYRPDEDSYHLMFVKGPDEYAGVTMDNVFTVEMAKHNIRLALKVAEKGLVEISDDERHSFQDLIEKAYVPYSEEMGTYLEDALFDYKEEIDIAAAKTDETPLYHRICFDRLQRLKVLKQPDVVLLYIMLPELFTAEQALNAWKTYEPICVHDSTLSWGMHALAAYRLGLDEEAESYLEKALFLDLEDRMENTGKEGLHIGGMGAALEAVIFGLSRRMQSFASWGKIKIRRNVV